MSSAGQRRYVLIDGLRGVASLSVAVMHTTLTCSDQVSPTLGAFLARGRLGVEVFFVISGFVIAATMMRSQVTARSATQFLCRRVIRLDPPYWASIGVCISVSWAASIVLPGHPYTFPTVRTLCAHALYLQYILGIPSLSDVYWTLCFEIQFYLLLTLFVAMTQRLEAAGVVRGRHLIFIPGLLVSAAFATGLIPLPRGACFGYWYAFLVGVGASWLVSGRGRTLLYLASLAAVCISLQTRTLEGVVSAGTGMLIALAHARGGLRTWLSGPVFQYLGRISYSLYLIHWTIGGHVSNLINHVVRGGPLTQFAIGLVGLGIAIVVADVFWRLIERPSILLSRSATARAVSPQVA